MSYDSSLSILNRAMLGVSSNYLLDVAKFDPRNLVYNPIEDYASDLVRVREGAALASIGEMPALVVTRIGAARELSEKSQDWKFTTLFDGTKEINYRLVELEYSWRVYTATFEETEFLLNQLLIYNPPKVMFTYAVPWLEPQELQGVLTLKLPGVESRVVGEDLRQTQGQVYCLTLKPTVRALLVDMPVSAPIVEKIPFTIYDTLNGEVRMAGAVVTATDIELN